MAADYSHNSSKYQENRFDQMESELNTVKKDIDSLFSKIQSAYPNGDSFVDRGFESKDLLHDKPNCLNFDDYRMSSRLFSSYSENDIHSDDSSDEFELNSASQADFPLADRNNSLRSWRSPDDYHHHSPLDNQCSSRKIDFEKYDNTSPRSLSPNSLDGNEYFIEDSDDVITFPICPPSTTTSGFSSHYRRILSTHYEEAEEYASSDSSNDSSILDIETHSMLSSSGNLSMDIAYDDSNKSMDSLNNAPTEPLVNGTGSKLMNSLKSSSLDDESDTDTYITVRSKVLTEHCSDSTSLTGSFKTCMEYASSEDGSLGKDFAVVDRNQNNQTNTSDDDISTVDSKDTDDSETEEEDVENEVAKTPKYSFENTEEIQILGTDTFDSKRKKSLKEELETLPCVNLEALVTAWREASAEDESVVNNSGVDSSESSEYDEVNNERSSSQSDSWHTIEEGSSSHETSTSTSSSDTDGESSANNEASLSAVINSSGKPTVISDSEIMSDVCCGDTSFNLAQESRNDSDYDLSSQIIPPDNNPYQFVHKMWSSSNPSTPGIGITKLSGTRADGIGETSKDQTHLPLRQTIDLSTKKLSLVEQRKQEVLIDNSYSELHPTCAIANHNKYGKEGILTEGNLEENNPLIIPTNKSTVNNLPTEQPVNLCEQKQSAEHSPIESSDGKDMSMQSHYQPSLDSPDLESGFSMSECTSADQGNQQMACFGKSLVPRNSQTVSNLKTPTNSVRAVASSLIHIKRADQLETTTSVQAEATGNNLSIAAARATAKAVGIASAGASEFQSGSDDSEIQFVITTSCKITPPVKQKPAILAPPIASPDETSMASSNESGQTIKALHRNTEFANPRQQSIHLNGPTLNQFLKNKFPEMDANNRTMSGNSSISSVMSLDVDAVLSDLKKSAEVSRSLSSKLYTPRQYRTENEAELNIINENNNHNNFITQNREIVPKLDECDIEQADRNSKYKKNHQSLIQSTTLPSHKSRIKHLKSSNTAEKPRQFKATDIDRANSMRHLSQYKSPLSLSNSSISDEHGACHSISFHDVAHMNKLKRAKSNPNNYFTSEYIIKETDIDTGKQAERSLLMETDIDNTFVDDNQQGKSHSMCNLLSERRLDSVPDITEDHNFNRAQSIATLSQRRRMEANENSLATRLANKAKSLTEMRIAESVKKLNVPDWLNRVSTDSTDLNTDSELKYQTIDSTPTYSTRSYTGKSNTISTKINPRYMTKPSATIESSNSLPKSFELPSKRLRTKSEETLSRIRPIHSKIREIAQNVNLSENSPKTPIKSILKRTEDKALDFHLDPKDFIVKDESSSTSKSSRRLVEEKLILKQIQPNVDKPPLTKEIILTSNLSDPSGESGISSGGISDILDAEKEREVRDFMSAPPSSTLNFKRNPNCDQMSGNKTNPSVPKRISSLSKTFTETNAINIVTKQGDNIVGEQNFSSTKTSTIDMPAIPSSTQRENIGLLFEEKLKQYELIEDDFDYKSLLHSFFIDKSKPPASNDARNLSSFQNDELISLLIRNLRLNVKDFYYDTNSYLPHLSMSGEIISQCSYKPCSKEHIINPDIYVSCENCYMYYCSKQCRSINRYEHRSVCTYGRPRYAANKILKFLAPSQIRNLSNLANVGYKTFGRGCIVLVFQNHAYASSFILKEKNSLTGPPLYLTSKDIDNFDSKLNSPCENYNPQTSMVLVIAVGANTCFGDVDECKYFKQCIVLPLENKSNREALSTTPRLFNTFDSLPANLESTKDSRDVYYQNIIRYFRDRGVILRSTYPDLFQKLTLFMELGIEFAPQSITFLDFTRGDLITCIVRPMCEPEIQSVGPPKQYNQNATFVTDL